MSMKTILVPIERHDSNPSALETALLLARKDESYIKGVAARCANPTLFFGDSSVPFPPESYIREVAAEAQRARQTFESFMQKHDVPRSTENTRSLSFGWLDEPLEGESVVGSHGRVFDLIVMNRPDAQSTGLYLRALESGLFESGRPMRLFPPTT